MEQQEAVSLALEGLKLAEEELSFRSITAGVIGEDGWRMISDDRIESALVRS